MPEISTKQEHYMPFRKAFLGPVICAITAFTLLSTTSIPAAAEDRTLLMLAAPEEAALRSEMRQLLISLSEVLDAMNENDMAGVETAARKSGMVMVGQVEVSLKEKLTPEFMQLGKSAHVGFDEIADAARDGASQDDLIGLLAEQTNRCTTCHSSYGLQ
jgi:hypothetical protein